MFTSAADASDTQTSQSSADEQNRSFFYLREVIVCLAKAASAGMCMLAPCSQGVPFWDGVHARYDPLYPFHARGLCLHSSLCLVQGVAPLGHHARAVYLSSLPAHCMYVEALTAFRVLACMQVVLMPYFSNCCETSAC